MGWLRYDFRTTYLHTALAQHTFFLREGMNGSFLVWNERGVDVVFFSFSSSEYRFLMIVEKEVIREWE